MGNNIRNVAVLGHMSSGKTTLVEGLYALANNTTMGSVDRKNTISDYTLEEQNRKSSIKSSIVPIKYNDYKINLIDIPGNDDFICEAIQTISVVKGAILVIDAKKGIEVETIKHYNMLKRKNIPTIIYVNKMDSEGVKFDEVFDNISSVLGKNAIPFCYPMGHNDNFDGFVNVVELKGRKYNGKTCDDCEIYPDKRAKVLELHNKMIEAVAESKEELMEKFFMGEELTRAEIKEGLREGVLNGSLIPVLVGSATKSIGLHTLLDMVIDYMPDPSDLKPIVGETLDGEVIERKTLDEEPFSAFIFKTNVDAYSGVTSIFKINSGVVHQNDEVYISDLNNTLTLSNIYTICGGKLTQVSELHAGDIGCVCKVDGLENSMTLSDPKSKVVYSKIEYPSSVYFKALKPKSKNDDDKLSSVLQKLKLEDPTLSIVRNRETKQLLLGTLSLGHLNYILERMKNSYKLEIDIEDYRVVYRETITKEAHGSGRYVKQSGGSGFYGVVEMKFEPAEENYFTEEVFGGAVPKNYFPAVEKGFHEACEKGLLKGYPVIGVHSVLLDGKYHAVDSNELSFKNASILAFKDAFMKAGPTILEPIFEMTITVESDLVGDILSDLNQRRAKIVGMEINSMGQQKLKALAPEIEILEYVNDLRSLTPGSGYFNRKFYGYEKVPAYLIDKIPENE